MHTFVFPFFEMQHHVCAHTCRAPARGLEAWRIAGAALVWAGRSCRPRAWLGQGRLAHVLSCPGSHPWLWGSSRGLQRDDSHGLLLCSRGWLRLFSCHLCYIAGTNAQLCRAWGGMVGHFPFIGFVWKLLLVGLIYSRGQQGQWWVGIRWRVSSPVFWGEALFCDILLV